MNTAAQTALHHALWGAGLAGALWLGLRWFERANLYFPSRTLEADPGQAGLKFEEVRAETADGVAIHGWFVEDRPQNPVLLFSHGNAGNISARLDKLVIFHRAGASVLLYDYRGYGRSAGRPSEAGTYADADAVYAWLTRVKAVPPQRIVFYGESLGAAVALESALRRPCAGLIIESAFTSVVEMGRRLFPFLPVRWLVRFRYDNISKVARLKVPLLVMHSPQDEIVPFEMGRRLFAAAPGPKTFFEMTGGHNDGFLGSGDAYGEAVRSFLSSLPRETAGEPVKRAR